MHSIIPYSKTFHMRFRGDVWKTLFVESGDPCQSKGGLAKVVVGEKLERVHVQNPIHNFPVISEVAYFSEGKVC